MEGATQYEEAPSWFNPLSVRICSTIVGKSPAMYPLLGRSRCIYANFMITFVNVSKKFAGDVS